MSGSGDARELVEAVQRSLEDSTRTEFDRRVEDQAEEIIAAIQAGALDNESFAIGLELEAYAVDREGRLARLPEAVFEDGPIAKELGLHNAEINTVPTVFDAAGVRAQARALQEQVTEARRIVGDLDRELVLDAMWTIPPPEGTRSYLGDVTTTDGVVLGTNLRPDPRYCALDNDIVRHAGGEIDLSLPGVNLSVPTILVEALTTSIQPHLQIPHAADLPAYYAVAIRTLGPVLALSTNSPFLPADLYGAADPAEVLEETYHELRIPVFEESINAQADGKVRFPEDLETPSDVVRYLVDDPVRAPFLAEWVEQDGSFSDTFWEFDYKRGTYWRWLRCVIGGQFVGPGNDEQSLRLEYRPLPTQPTVEDIIGLQCLVSGLIRGLVATEHPLADLPWEAARSSFYSAVRKGLDADLHWITEAGERTDDVDEIFTEVFDVARTGLLEAGLDSPTVDDYLRPIEARWTHELTPSRWKLERVRTGIEGGNSLEEAIVSMQRDYLRLSASDTPFISWA